MAYAFNAASNQYISATSSPLGTAQLSDHTIGFWVRAASAASGTLVSMSRSTETASENNPAILVQVNSTYLRYFLRANSAAGGVGWMNLLGNSGHTAFDNTWKHCACRLADASTVSTASSYVGGALNQTSTAGAPTPTTTGLDRLGLAAAVRGNVSSYSTATMCEVGIWSAALTAEEIAALARGVTCEHIRPQSLVFYAPLIRDAVDLARGVHLSNNNGATVADHPRVYA